MRDAQPADGAWEGEPLRLVSRVPEPGALNVWARAPIVLTFSAALDAASVTSDSIRVEDADGPLDAELQLEENGRQVHLSLQQMPQQPSELTVVVTDRLRDRSGNAFAGEQWSFSAPVWHSSEALALELATATDASIAIDAQDHPLVAWLVESDQGMRLQLARVGAEGWQSLGDAPLMDFAQGDRDPAIYVQSDATVWVAFVDQDGSVHVRSYKDESWAPPLVAWKGSGTLESFDLAVADGTPVLAALESSGAVRSVQVLRYDATAVSWTAIGTPLDAKSAQTSSRLVVAAGGDGQVALAWLEHDGHSENLYLSRYAQATETWSPLGAAVDLELDARVSMPALAITQGGALVVGWNEGPLATSTAYVARAGGSLLTGLGGALGVLRASHVAALTFDARGEATALLQTRALLSTTLSVARYNGSPAPPFGLSERPQARCSIPAESDLAFPQTLTATGCFDDVAARKPASGLIPYNINSPLWSDGTLKRRFVMIPDGATIGFTKSDAWMMPVGTVLVKEFLLTRSPEDLHDAVPLETRFMVKRCEPGDCRAAWQGYSYQWNDEGSEATLLDNTDETVFKEWTVGGNRLNHGYPGREQCMQCHANAAGGALGMKTGQLNRNLDYGEHVDNQLRALGHIGLFGESHAALDEGAIEPLLRLPVPTDPGYSNEQRARSYLHSNCSHCHRPEGRWPVMDLQWSATLRAVGDPNPNVCDKIVPGDASASLLFQKISGRGTLPPEVIGDPMPPLGTSLVDTRQLPVIAAWLNELQSCP